MAMQPYSPIDDIMTAWRDLGRFWGGGSTSLHPHSISEWVNRHNQQLDLYETANGYDLHFPIAGANPDDIDVTVQNNVVTIGWETTTQIPANAKQLVSGIQHGKYQEQFSLPCELDANATGANYENGVLYLHLAKAPQATTKKIKIASSQGQSGQGQISSQKH